MRVLARARGRGGGLGRAGGRRRPGAGEAKQELLAVSGEAGRVPARSARAARARAGEAPQRARALPRARGAKPSRQPPRLGARVERPETPLRARRAAGRADPHPSGRGAERGPAPVPLRPGRAPRSAKGKPGRPTAFGHLEQPAALRANTNPGAPGFILPPTAAPGTPGEHEPRPQPVAEPRSPWPPTAAGRARGRRPDEADRGGARAARSRTHPHRRPRPAPLQADAATAHPPPGRRRGAELAPETPSSPAPQPPERWRRPAHPDGQGGVRPQRRDGPTLPPSQHQEIDRSQQLKGEAQRTATSPTRPPVPHRRLSGRSS